MTNSGPSFFILLLPRKSSWTSALLSDMQILLLLIQALSQCVRVNVGKFSWFPNPRQSFNWETVIDSLSALTLSFTEEHLQGCGSHILRTLKFPFVGIERGNRLICGCLWKIWQCVLGEAWIHSAILVPWIMKIENNCLSLQLLHFSIFGKKHKERNKTSIRNHYSTYLGIHFFESREINLMARHELQDWLH